MRVEDTWRSLKRWLALAFPDPWVIRLEQAQYVEEERPLIIVEPIGDATRGGVQPTIPSRPHVVSQTFVLTAYPALVEDPRDARQSAAWVLDLFDHLVTVGWIEDDVPIGGPLRVPVWDYEAVPVGGPDRGNAHALNEWEQLAWAETYNGLMIPDPQDDRRYTVPYTLRLSWQAASRYVPADPVAGFGGVFVADPPQQPPPVQTPSPGPPAPIVPVIQGPAGPVGLTGPEGPPGGAMVTGWWDYSPLTTPAPTSGQIRTAPDPTVVGTPLTVYLSARDDDGLYWLDADVQPGDEFVLRGTAGAVQRVDVTSFDLTVPGSDGYGTVVGVPTLVTGQIAKNARVEVALIREP